MATRMPEHLLYDSETTLRLVDNVIDELQVMEDQVTRSEDRVRVLAQSVDTAHAGITDLPAILLRAYGEIQNVLDSLRQSRNVLERTTVEKIHHMHDKLREVTSATEVAATDILDGLDRALLLVDRLEGEEAPEGDRAEAIGDLRNELFSVMGCLQFQDITSQQLSYASSVLGDMESRLAQLAAIFDPAKFGMQPVEPRLETNGPVAFDPAATTRDAETRQALVDEIFGK